MSLEDLIKEGDTVVLYFSMTNISLIDKITTDGTTHNSCGFFHHSDIIGKPFGSKIHPRLRSEYPRPLHALKPTPELFTLSIPHRTQIIYHADISMIMMALNILPGSTVAEAGTGSASLSYSIGYTIGPRGRLYTFEIDNDRALHNQQLLANVLPPNVVTVSQRDVIVEGFPREITVDAVFLDLPSPWLAIPNAAIILKENGRICTFSPSIEQVSKNVSALGDNGFHEIKTVEVMLKPWGLDIPREAQIGEKRKKHASNEDARMQSFQLPMRGHTSYLTFAIKKLADEDEYPLSILSLSTVSMSAKARKE
jgi:tRNA (adenine57-N1/adenine58-N1)-methyltransferase